jgi:hypothetical protein
MLAAAMGQQQQGSATNMASLSIEESSSSPIKSLETASPTVILPSMTDKTDESSSDHHLLGASSSSCGFLDVEDGGSSALGGLPSPSASASSSSLSSQDDTKEGKKKKSRCLSCKKKVGLTGFTCRCGGLFCSIHRYSDKHECNFDYKVLGAEEIRKSNPVVMAKKVQKI